jgi:gliding motility-associated-like protein
MRTILFFFIGILLALPTLAQNNYNNHWFFGKGHHTNFSTGTIVNGGIPYPVSPRSYQILNRVEQFSAATSSINNSELLFFVAIPKILSGGIADIKSCFFDKMGNAFPNGDIYISSYEMDNGKPLIVPHPLDTSQYYVFTCLDKGLQYTIVDLRLRNGLGDVVPNAKLIPLMPKNTIMGSKLTVAKGCNKLFVYAKMSNSSGYVHFILDNNGIDSTPIYNDIGTLPLRSYVKSKNIVATMKASPNGLLLATATQNGVELYDISPCNGMLYNARLIDTTMSFGICFSPDNQLLYTTRAEYQTGYKESSEIVQWNVSNAQDLNSIKASEQVIMINSAYYWPNWIAYLSSYMGDIAQGKDGKLYILSNTVYDNLDNQYPIPLPPTTIVPETQTMHIIHQPNNRGMACMPERDAHKLEGSYMNRADYYLPHPILTVPSNNVDTVYGTTQYPKLCFGKATTLYTPSGASCIAWSTGASTDSLHITDTGTYWVQYYLQCQIHIDTYRVGNVMLPQIPTYLLACKDRASLDIVADTPYTTLYHYLLWSHSIADERRATSDSSVRFALLRQGRYSLNISTQLCDTTIEIEVAYLPQSNPVVSPADTTIPYGTTIALEASGSLYYTWQPRTYLDTASGAVVYTTPQQDISYTMVSINPYGCIDTAYCHIAVSHPNQLLLPNAFSPNGDGLNDRFGIMNIGYERLVEWTIYNRYGTKVYEGTSLYDAWDGTNAGKPCDVGVYYYYLQYVGSDGRIQQLKGEVHLVR